MKQTAPAVSLRSPLTIKNAFLFPVQNELARHDLWVGGLIALIPVLGWLANMGHRIAMVNRFHKGIYPWPAWSHFGRLLKYGSITFLGMIHYYSVGLIVLAAGLHFRHMVFVGLGIVLLVAALIAIPGYMTFYCREFDPSEIFNPLKAVRRVFQGGKAYWKAWSIILVALPLSFLGLLVFGIGFAWTSVWFWQVAAFCFANVFTRRYQRDEKP